MKASVSIDKFVMEYKDVPHGVYCGLVRDAARNGFQTKETFYWGEYCYELHIRKANGAYLHVFYKNKREKAGFTLRLETRPEHYLDFGELLEPIRRAANRIYFVGCDVAYDVRTSLENVVVIPADMRREMTNCGTTRYFGLPHQRKTNG